MYWESLCLLRRTGYIFISAMLTYFPQARRSLLALVIHICLLVSYHYRYFCADFFYYLRLHPHPQTSHLFTCRACSFTCRPYIETKDNIFDIFLMFNAAILAQFAPSDNNKADESYTVLLITFAGFATAVFVLMVAHHFMIKNGLILKGRKAPSSGAELGADGVRAEGDDAAGQDYLGGDVELALRKKSTVSPRPAAASASSSDPTRRATDSEPQLAPPRPPSSLPSGGAATSAADAAGSGDNPRRL
jgi:hypothetical protein